MKTIAFFSFAATLSSLLFIRCQSADPAQNSSAEVSGVVAANPDSLRLAYQVKLSERSDRLPTTRPLEKGKVYPVDEAPLDTAFFLFRESLLDAIARRDVLQLLDACNENIRSSLGGEDALADFVERWGLDKDANGSELWSVLEQILAGGGSFDRERRFFTAPYTFSDFPDDYDAFSYGLITGEGVRLRATPSLQARIVTNLNYDVVERLPTEEEIIQAIGGEEHSWVKIRTLDGREGWIYGKYFAVPIGYRAGFERQPNGAWEMVFLVAGD